MKRFTGSLAFRIGVIITLAEIIVLAIVGYVYLDRFAREVDRRIEAQVQIPGRLMQAGLLDLNAVEDQHTMTRLVGEEIIDGMVIGTNNVVFFSLDPDNLGRDVADIPGVNIALLDGGDMQPKIVHTAREVVSVSPVFGSDQQTPRYLVYVKAATAAAESEKAELVWLFVFGSATAVALTSVILFFSFNATIFTRIADILRVLWLVQEGDLTARAAGTGGRDEISTLQQGLNATIAKLEESIAARERRLQELRETQQELAQSEERFRQLAENIQQVFWIVTVGTGELLYVSPAYEMIWQRSRASLYQDPQSFIDAIHPQDRERVVANLGKQSESEYDDEYRIIQPGGTARWVRTRSFPIHDTSGKVYRVAGITDDITERKKSEEMLKQREQQLESFFSQSLDGFFFMMLDEPVRWDNTVDKEQVLDYVFTHQRMTEVNDAMLAQYGASQEDFLGLTPADFFAHDLAHGRSVWREFFDHGRYQIETYEQKFDGTPMWIEGEYVCLHDEQGRITGHFGIQREITEQKEAKEQLKISHANLEKTVSERTAELRLAKEQAEAANQAKSVFLANMSHELRTPLNAILGYTQILKQEPGLTLRQQDALSTIQQSGGHLLNLITEILDLAKVEAGKLELQPAPMHLAAFLNDIVTIIRAQARAKQLHFSFNVLPALPVNVEADETRLRQVLLNLLNNAVKFTEEGQVTFSVTAVGEIDGSEREGNLQPRRARLRFEVIDTGIGIAAEQLTKIFEPFEQAGEQQYRVKGAGLGLAISYQLIAMMGGDLQVESRIGEGSSFWFEVALPLVEKPESAESEPPRVIGYQRGDGTGPQQPVKVLVVDDVPENRAMVVDMLQPLGFALFEAANGQAGVVQAERLRPDLILMDNVMPVLDGLTATRQIRQAPGLEGVVIITISARTFAQDRRDSLAAGANAFVTKPIEMELLLQEIDAHLDISWLYDAPGGAPAVGHEAAAEVSEMALVPPPPSELEVLYELALFGNMRRIQEQAARIAELNEHYAPFAHKLITLARRFDEKEILVLLESYLDTDGGSNEGP